MAKYKLLILIFMPILCIGQTQQIDWIDFENGGIGMYLNSSDSPGLNYGNNKWIVNDDYNGNNIYPNTTGQLNQPSGPINFPNGNYLHVYDSTFYPSIANANYNPLDSSNNFVILNNGWCTLGFSNVTLRFVYICEGNNNAYGEVYYRVNGGSWTQTGFSQFNNTNNQWMQTTISNPNFDNVLNLQFGFRWINDSNVTTFNTPMGIDDVQLWGDVGLTNLLTTSITSVPSSICQGTNLIFGFEISDTLCTGNYEIELSDGIGNFNNILAQWSFNLGYPNTNGFLNINIPNTIPAGTCYKIRVNRISPLPQIIGTSSVCIDIQNCPNTIITLQPAVTIGSEAPNGIGVCVGSVIDIPFWSTGIFNNGNWYIAELSDSSGSFNNPIIIGANPDNSTYDPTLVPNPGSVSGEIPQTTPGCNYFIRVISTNPTDTGTIWGPFCIKECDIQTNNKQDINFCITSTIGDSTTIAIDINTPPSNLTYSNNIFSFEILDMQSFNTLDIGSFGSINSNTSCSLNVTSPPYPGLLSLGLQPGMYYARVIATNANDTTNMLGTVIRLSIGYPFDGDLLIYSSPSDSLVCLNDILIFYTNPYNSDSEYQWYLNGTAFPFVGTPFAGPNWPLGVQFTATGTNNFTVQETNYGCTGPMSSGHIIEMINPPNITNIFGPNNVCYNDTSSYLLLPFQNHTIYNWNVPCGTIIDTANNEVNVKWNMLNGGACNIDVEAINVCGTDNDFKSIIINSAPNANAGSDLEVCEGDSILIIASGGDNYSWTPTNILTNPNNDSTYIYTTMSTELIVTITNINNCQSQDSVLITVNNLPEIDAGNNEIICLGDSYNLLASGGDQYIWDNNTSLNNLNINNPVASPNNTTTYHVTGTDNSTGCQNTDSITIIVEEPSNAGVGGDFDFCQDGNMFLLTSLLNSTPNLNGFWTSPTGNTISNFLDPNNAISGSYTYTVASNAPCPSDNSTLNLNFYKLPNAGSNTSIFICKTTGTINLVDSINGNPDENGYWLDQDLNYITGFIDINNFTTGEYMYIVDGNNICDNDTSIIDISSCFTNIFIPNSFSPNNDSHNDIFTPVSNHIKNYELYIFNRWGQNIFYNNQQLGWDGKYKNKLCPSGIYTWKIYYDIIENDINVKKHITGQVNLIR